MGILIAYGLWGVLPVLAYVALMAGVERRLMPLIGLFSLYSLVTFVTGIALNGQGVISRMGLALPWGLGAALMALMYFVGTKAGTDDR
jgi:hypothetical protein